MKEMMKRAAKSIEAELDAKFEKALADFRAAKSEWTCGEGCTVYYVSVSDGNDDNDGLSGSSAWKTLAKVNGAELKYGDVVLFKRGDEWNGKHTLDFKNGVTYSAYGEGAKPIISSDVRANKTSDWTLVGENLWVYSGEYFSDFPDSPRLENHKNDPALPGSYVTSIDADKIENDDIGNIVLRKNGVEGWGIKITKNRRTNTSVELGRMWNGFSYIIRRETHFVDQFDLASEFEFYHNPDESRVYFYCPYGNPAEYFDDIRLVLRGYLTNGWKIEGTVVDNIAFLYCGCHGINVGHAKNFTVRNCEIGWIGGAIQTYTFGGRDFPTRFGEGFQNWQDCDGLYVYNNYFHDVYDGAMSSQSLDRQNGTIMKDIQIKGNLFENNSANIEIWMNNSPPDDDRFGFVDFGIEENLIRNMGYGFGQTRAFFYTENTFSNIECVACAITFSQGKDCSRVTNCHFRNNTMWRTTHFFIRGMHYSMNGNGVQVYDNTMVRLYNEPWAAIERDPVNIISPWDMNYKYYNEQTVQEIMRLGLIGENKFLYTEE